MSEHGLMGWWSGAAEQWWSWMAPMVWQVGVLVLLVAILDGALRRWVWPQLRIALWLLVIAKLLLPPTVASPVAISPQVLPLTTWSTVGASAATTAPHSPWISLAMLAWGLGILVLGTVSVWRWRSTRRGLGRRSQALDSCFEPLLHRAAQRVGLRRVPEVRVVQSGHHAAVYGFWRPTVIIPSSLLEQPEHLENAFLHELAHIKRGDLWVHGFCHVVQLAYWFHPCLWFAGRRIRELRELCCDATVASILRESTADYRNTLLMTARRLLDSSAGRPRPESWAAGGMGFVTPPANIVARLRYLDGSPWKHTRVRRVATVATMFVWAITVLPMASSVAANVGQAHAVDPETVAVAEETLEAARRGEFHSCLRVRYATMALLSQANEEAERER